MGCPEKSLKDSGRSAASAGETGAVRVLVKKPVPVAEAVAALGFWCSILDWATGKEDEHSERSEGFGEIKISD